MSARVVVQDLSHPTGQRVKKKRVLLVDTSAGKRELRAEAMRRLGMDVDCACDISEARSWWRADLYNLVLINMKNEMGRRDKFCDDVRGATPPQELAFLVGKPEYLADLPNGDGEIPIESNDVQAVRDRVSAVRPGDEPAVPGYWGIMEASRRISAVRSESAARAQAMRNRPTPPRDLEIQHSRGAKAESPLLEPERLESEKEEMK
jgi:CheY-like chemotaxis protein